MDFSNNGELDRVLVLAAHPDDESIGCAGLLQRARQGLVVFAVDGAPPQYSFEKQFGSLQNYSRIRFEEASGALRSIPEVSARRLTRPDGTAFVDQHLVLELPEAFASLCQMVSDFAPSLIVSHAFEGGHVDHDACHVLAKEASAEFGLKHLEFPLYWRETNGKDVFQRFRPNGSSESVLQLTSQELHTKRQMLTEYRTQQDLTSVFTLENERFRCAAKWENSKPDWPDYPFENRRRGLKAAVFLQKVAEFQQGKAKAASHR
jgi:N-acetylglucosamine malate deacetylase 2